WTLRQQAWAPTSPSTGVVTPLVRLRAVLAPEPRSDHRSQAQSSSTVSDIFVASSTRQHRIEGPHRLLREQVPERWPDRLDDGALVRVQDLERSIRSPDGSAAGRSEALE